MMIFIVLTISVVVVTYFLLLGRLASLVRAKKPELFAAVGGLHMGDFFLMGFGTGDGLISKLEEHHNELREEHDIARLVRWARIAWCAQLLMMVIAVFAVVAA